MSTLLNHTSPPRKDRQRFRRHGRRLSRPGVSLLAQGEPLIWFTGGALAVCVAMIAGLLLLVFWWGLPSFWPTPLVQFKLASGSVVLGEVVRDETFELAADELSLLDEADRARVRERLGGQSSLNVRRRLLRTGNFELSGEHFRWVANYQVAPDGESVPNWATTVERLEWGRFYGQPARFTIRHVRPVSADEQALQTLTQFATAQRWRVPAEKSEEFDKAFATLQERLSAVRGPGVRAFVSRMAASIPGGTAVMEDGTTVDLASVTDNAPVVEVHEVVDSAGETWQAFEQHHAAARARYRQQRELERHDIGAINSRLERARLDLRAQELAWDVSAIPLATEWQNQVSQLDAIQAAVKEAEETAALARRVLPSDSPLRGWFDQFAAGVVQDGQTQQSEPQRAIEQLAAQRDQLPADVSDTVDQFLATQQEAAAKVAEIQARIEDLRQENNRFELIMVTADGQEKPLRLADIVRAFPPNRLTLAGKLGVYCDRWWEYLTDEPREANSEGGILPAIWGTVVMTLVMTMMVVPFGVLAALYLREYAQSGWIVSSIRISISNLAGVPSIVFGVFGLGFFCYLVGAYLDGGAANAGIEPLMPRVWWLSLFGLGVVALAAFATGMVAITDRPSSRDGWRRWVGVASLVLWLAACGLAVILIFRTPFFGGFFATSLPNPTLGKGGMIWASLTLSLLTLPVVIVATEEALSSVPNSLREGSYACGASKWQTIRRIILPHAMPGIMTGMILAMARGAGEVAPLMLVGAVKLQPELPVDGEFPFVHLSRSFMHLGFHIFDLGFQSQNSDAAIPMVFTTTMLLIGIIATLNLAAIWIRSHLRKRYLGGQF